MPEPIALAEAYRRADITATPHQVHRSLASKRDWAAYFSAPLASAAVNLITFDTHQFFSVQGIYPFARDICAKIVSEIVRLRLSGRGISDSIDML